MEINTLKDLKEFLGTLNDEQLSTPAILSIVDSGYERITTADVTEEDEYLTDEGFAPISTFEPEDDLDKLDSYEIRKAGHPYLLNE